MTRVLQVGGSSESAACALDMQRDEAMYRLLSTLLLGLIR